MGLIALIVGVLCILIIATTIIFTCNSTYPKPENYTEVPLLVYNVNINPATLDIRFGLPSSFGNKAKNDKNKGFVYVMDVYSFCKELPTGAYKAVTMYDDRTISVFIKPSDDLKSESLISVLESNTPKQIGYFETSDKGLIQNIAISMGINTPITNLKQLSRPASLDVSLSSKSFFEKNNIYALFLRIPIKSVPHIGIRFDFLSYDNAIDLNKLKFLIPYAQLQDVDLSVLYPAFKGGVRTCVAYDMVFAGSLDVERNTALSPYIEDLIARQGTLDLINYYTMHIPFFEQTYTYISKRNEHLLLRDNLPILEQFENKVDILGKVWDQPCETDCYGCPDPENPFCSVGETSNYAFARFS